MGLTTAERNRRKRERKKKERDQQQKEQQLQQQKSQQEDENGNRENTASEAEHKQEESSSSVGTGAASTMKQDPTGTGTGDGADDANKGGDAEEDADIEVEYVPEPLQLPEDQFADVLRAVQLQQQAVAAQSSHVVSDEDDTTNNHKKRDRDTGDNDDDEEDDDDEDDEENGRHVSKRKLRELLRPTVAELKKRVNRPDLVEAHDVTAHDPDFLIALKSVPGTVPVPRHWGRKRKYLQGKRGFEKPPFQLPDFIVNTGITEVRDAANKEDSDRTAKQRNRLRVAPKMGAIDVDYKVLYDAFFKHQTKPANLSKFGELYYEGKELELNTSSIKPGWPFSKQLREALGMVLPTSPPPWLVNMQRYGPPPSYPGMKIPGLNAPLPTPECQYGYHPGGWGKPPLDPYGRPLYGGNPFDPPGTFGRSVDDDVHAASVTLVTSDGKTLGKSEWGALPTVGATADLEDEEESEEEEESGSEMDESEEEGEELIDGMESVLPPPPIPATAPKDLRKVGAGDETPLPTAMGQAKPLYRVIEQKATSTSQQLQAGAVFASEVSYVVPGANLPEGAESVLSKAPDQIPKRKAKDVDDDDDDGGLDKKFKF